MELGVLEGILFVMGDEGASLETIAQTMNLDEDKVKELLRELKTSYENENRGLRVSYLGNAFKLTTKPEHKEYYEKLVTNPNTNKLTQAALETLAIVAYNQPITISEINEIRGVQSNQLVRKLVAKGFLKEAGKSELAGRPNLYKTTSEFLDYFGLSKIDDLPKIDVEETNEEESELFSSIYKEESV